MYELKSLSQTGQRLVEVAMGRQAAQLVIKNAKLVNVLTHEIINDTDIAVSQGRIALVGDASHCIGAKTEVIDASGYYVTPGFMDGHIHVESSMVTVSEYSSAVVPNGTTAIFMDPHEIANVLGMDGVKLMMEEAKNVPLRVFTTVPSCVPAAPGFEDNGSTIRAEDITEALGWKDVVGLGEMMNFPAVTGADEAVHQILAATLTAGKTITGHYSIPETGKGLNAYIASGIRCCHESVHSEDALAKMRLGMYAQMREGSAWHDVKETVKAITERSVDTRFATLVSDDTHPHTLLSVGHLNHVVRRAIEEGVDPITAIQMVTINVAQCFHCDMDYGSIAPGKVADILLLSDLSKVKVEKVVMSGRLVAENGRMLSAALRHPYPEWAKKTVKLAHKLHLDDFVVYSERKGLTTARVIEVFENKTSTKLIHAELSVFNKKILPDTAQDISKVAVVERHKGTGTIGNGFVKGFGLKRGAVAATIAHDCHNLMIVGTDDYDMAFAGNKLAEVGGGLIAVCDGEVLAIVPLPIAGLMSDKPIEKVNAGLETLALAWRTLGSTLESPFMTMALLALPVLPEVRITNRGLVESVRFEFVDVEV